MPDNEPEQRRKPTVIVGIGASAGGIQACSEMLDAMTGDTGAAFVFVLHLDPTRSSNLASILQTHARTVQISQAAGRVHLKPNCGYVIAPDSKLHFEDGMLEVKALDEGEQRGALIDYMLSSLAEAEGERAVGILLSGGGRDGSVGLRRIREVGGLCIVQDPATASSRSMPQSAIDSGVTDVVLSPDAMPRALARFAGDGRWPESTEARTRNNGGDAWRENGSEASTAFSHILKQLGKTSGINFEDYKSGTLERRTERRMSLKGIDDRDRYAAQLAEDPEELEALYRDVLIGVTDFYRDPDVWDRLAAELPPVLAQRDGAGVRAWVPGCGSGEEVYSLAMQLLELVGAKEHARVHIYATDVNTRALAVARRGIYEADALDNVSEKLRSRYFVPRDSRLQVDRRLRDCVTFAPHNVLGDPPFSNMDIVSCRNLLIYLNSNAHDRLLRRLHFALRTGGVLLLGRAETLGRLSRLFEEISKSHSIFRSRAVTPQERFHVAPRTTETARHERYAPLVDTGAPAGFTRRGREAGPERRIERYMLRNRTAASVVVTDDLEIRHFFGPTQHYLVPPTGESRPDLLAWVRTGFYIRLRSALKQALESDEPLAVEGKIDRNGETRRVECSIEAIPAPVGGERLFLVSFRDIGEAAPRTIDPNDADEPVVRELEQELLDTRRELQSTVENLDAAGEEPRASHEELLSLNEELQSSNEELEASKEELEALNEEMNTINRELEEKNFELRAANNDLNNLFLGTGIPTVFLDTDLKIRRFTPTATDVLRLVKSDVGRAIEHIRECIHDGRTVELCRQVLASNTVHTSEIWSDDERCYVRKILPYRDDDDAIDGVCMTFSDITRQKQVTRESEAARAYSAAIVATVRAPCWYSTAT